MSIFGIKSFFHSRSWESPENANLEELLETWRPGQILCLEWRKCEDCISNLLLNVLSLSSLSQFFVYFSGSFISLDPQLSCIRNQLLRNLILGIQWKSAKRPTYTVANFGKQKISQCKVFALRSSLNLIWFWGVLVLVMSLSWSSRLLNHAPCFKLERGQPMIFSNHKVAPYSSLKF